MALTSEQRVVHFLNRTSFGPTVEEIQRVSRVGIAAYLDEQLHPEKIPDAPVEEKIASLKTIRLSSRELIELYPQPNAARQQPMEPGMRAQRQMEGPRVVILELQQARLLRAVYSRRQLYEVMVDFWSNHFNIFAAKGADRWLTTSYDRDTIRPNTMGKFRDLLLATAQSPAMLFYLDNWLSVSPTISTARLGPNNIRRGLNENYARELMELHTLGVDGGYTQKDVQEVARCFTGWTINRPRGQGEFRFEPRLHDDGPKMVLGVKFPPGGGMEDGLKVIDLLTNHPSTARFISLKLARRFISDNPPPSIVNKAADAFRQSGGDIPSVLRVIIDSPEFFSRQAYQGKVKKPLEFVASALRLTGAETQINRQLLRYLARMGEPLFLAQPPTGFPDTASSWISADMLLTRINFASDLMSNQIPGTRVPADAVRETAKNFRLMEPESLSTTSRDALAESEGAEAIALFLASPEFHRR
jgi:uncharacterized protein (DUF1800 family)